MQAIWLIGATLLFGKREYTDRLRFLDLPSLKYRRKRGDLIQVYNILNSDTDNALLQFSECKRTRGNEKKLFKKGCSTNIRKFSFSQRIIQPWNNLPHHIVSVTDTNKFIKLLDGFPFSEMYI